jgi:hypothetical protein
MEHGRADSRVNPLAHMFSLCSILHMTRIDEQSVADALLHAPGWARVGLCAPTSWMREEAARELARAVIDGKGDAVPSGDQEQLPL